MNEFAERTLETPRLRLIPCTCTELLLGARSLKRLAEAKGLTVVPDTWKEARLRKRVFRAKAALIREAPQAWLLCTAWLIADRNTHMLMGNLGFKGYLPPEGNRREDGSQVPSGEWERQHCFSECSGRSHGREVEVGYGLHGAFRGCGYMTEAVGALCRFAFGQNMHPVSCVLALTKPSNTASQRVLQKNGFQREADCEGLFCWRRYRRV